MHLLDESVFCEPHLAEDSHRKHLPMGSFVQGRQWGTGPRKSTRVLRAVRMQAGPVISGSEAEGGSAGIVRACTHGSGAESHIPQCVVFPEDTVSGVLVASLLITTATLQDHASVNPLVTGASAPVPYL